MNEVTHRDRIDALALRLWRLKREHRIPQREVARRAGLFPEQLSQLLHGARNVPGRIAFLEGVVAQMEMELAPIHTNGVDHE